MRSQKSSIEDKILSILFKPRFYSKGLPVSYLGLPDIFGLYERQSVSNALYILKKKDYVICKNKKLFLSLKGKKYIENRKTRFATFESPFKKSSPKNLLVIFDIPEIRKAEREWFRFHLRSFGYEMVQKSVWVGPSPLPKEFLDYVKFIKLKDCIKTFKLAKSYTNT